MSTVSVKCHRPLISLCCYAAPMRLFGIFLFCKLPLDSCSVQILFGNLNKCQKTDYPAAKSARLLLEESKLHFLPPVWQVLCDLGEIIKNIKEKNPDSIHSLNLMPYLLLVDSHELIYFTIRYLIHINFLWLTSA